MRFHEIVLESEREELQSFLSGHGLQYEDDIDETLVLIEDERIIATASSAKNIIKCIAVDETYRGRNLLATLMSEIIKRLAAKGIDHYFVYTYDEQAPMFKALGMKPIVSTMTLALLEGGASIEETLADMKTRYRLGDERKACVVLNANPLTNGHMHLIDEASKSHERVIVFVVSEDRSAFAFEDRFKIVEKACATRKNVTVMPSGAYLVSYATFPKYFNVSETDIREEHALIDVLVFKEHYMKTFNIVHRYVGEEPLSPMTDIYNDTMRKYLGDALTVIPRKTLGERVISASHVRSALARGELDAIADDVPEATRSFLKTEAGRETLERIKRQRTRH